MLSSIKTNDITDARGQVQYTSLGNRTLNKFIDILSSVPERQKLRLIFLLLLWEKLTLQPSSHEEY